MNAAEHGVLAAISQGPEALKRASNVRREHQDAIVALGDRRNRSNGNFRGPWRNRSLDWHVSSQ